MNSYWWFKPHTITAAFSLPLLLIAALVPESWYLANGASKFLDLESFTIGLVGLLAFIAGAWLVVQYGAWSERESGIPVYQKVDERLYRLMWYAVFAATMFGYVIWLWDYILNPGMALPVLQGVPGAMYEARRIADRVPGVTSLSNLGPLYVVLYALHSTFTGRPLHRIDRLLLGIFLLFVLARVVIYSERRALFEVAVPFLAIIFAQTVRHRRLIALVPVLGFFGLIVVFAMTEYIRSWSNYYVEHWDSFYHFVLFRLFAYYTMALNTGAGAMQHLETLFIPEATAQWFWRFPLDLVPGGMRELFGFRTGRATDFLYSFANEEFNNRAGLYSVYIDFGFVAGTFGWLLLGLFSGWLYYRFIGMGTLGLLLFPTWLPGILEIPRVFYFGYSSYFPPLLATLILAFLLHRQRRTDAVAAPFEPFGDDLAQAGSIASRMPPS